MANRFPKNPRFSNITVSNNGNGLVDSDKVNAETVYVKNLVVTDTMRIPVSNLHNLNPEDKTFIRINRQYQPIAKDSGLLFLDSIDGNMKIQKDGEMIHIADPNQVGDVSNIPTYSTSDYTDFIVNNDNKFTKIYQDIEFKGEQPPLSKDFILGSNNNINFRNDDSNYYIFDGYIVANVKKPSSGKFESAMYQLNDDEVVKLKMYEPKFSAFSIESGLIRLQDNDINRYSINTINSGINNIDFKIVKLSIGNKIYLSIICENNNGNFITWCSKIRIYKINVVHSNNPEKPYILNNLPGSDIEDWNGYSIDHGEIYFQYSKHIDFYSIPIFNQAQKDGNVIPNSIFKKNISTKKVRLLDDGDNELLMIHNNEYLKYNMSDDIAKFKNNSNHYNYIISNKSLIVRDGLINSNLLVPYIYKDTLNFLYNRTKEEVNNFNINNGFWKKKVEYPDHSDEYIEKVFTNTTVNNNQIIDYSYLEDNHNNYFDLYQFSVKEMFLIRKPLDVEAYRNQTFLKKVKNEHMFIYKEIGEFPREFKQIYLDSNNTNYKFDFGTINILNGYITINDTAKNMNFAYKLQGYFYIPSFQEIRADLIDKIISKKINNSNIYSYLENTFCNKAYFQVKNNKIMDDDILDTTYTQSNRYIKLIQNYSQERNYELYFDIKVLPNDINLNIEDTDDYAIIAKKLMNIDLFYMNVCLKYHSQSDLVVACLIKNNVFNVFSI